uniref:Dynactin subunit 4 n=1 Tax=Timema cristinae TaxID=61476 RepID=A0A7R9H0Q6_TIMCR|nr:unnamed protein product [Timema cristinae]
MDIIVSRCNRSGSNTETYRSYVVTCYSYHVPEVRLVTCEPLRPGDISELIIKLSNPTQHQTTIQFASLPSPEEERAELDKELEERKKKREADRKEGEAKMTSLQDDISLVLPSLTRQLSIAEDSRPVKMNLTGDLKLPTCSVVLPPRDDAAEYDDSGDIHNFQDDIKVVVWRKANKAAVKLAVQPHNTISHDGVDVRTGFVLKYSYVNTITTLEQKTPQSVELQARVYLNIGKTVVCWGKKELLAKSRRSQLCLKMVCWGKKELLCKSPHSQFCLKVVCWGKKELLAKSPRSQLCLKMVCWGKKELLAKSPRSQLRLKVVYWGKELLAKSPRSQLYLKGVCWGKKVLAKSPRSQLCLKFGCALWSPIAVNSKELPTTNYGKQSTQRNWPQQTMESSLVTGCSQLKGTGHNKLWKAFWSQSTQRNWPRQTMESSLVAVNSKELATTNYGKQSGHWLQSTQRNWPRQTKESSLVTGRSQLKETGHNKLRKAVWSLVAVNSKELATTN